MAINTDSTFNGKTIQGRTTVTSGEQSATMFIRFFTEVNNPDGLDVGYPSPSIVCAAINAYAAAQGWTTPVTFTVDSPADVVYSPEDFDEAVNNG